MATVAPSTSPPPVTQRNSHHDDTVSDGNPSPHGRPQRRGTAWCLTRRADAGEVIGLALEVKAAGEGHRVIAARLGRPASTVRGWLRAFTRRAEQVRSVFTALAASLVTDPPLPVPAGPGVADAVAAVAAAAAAAARVPGVGTVARWELAAAVTCGLLLAPAWPARVANTSWLWAAPR